ncbi:hypothetical protein SDC9_124947 [bioreactor metagenome]|uniref:Uncharacterized protein n=1 Tax=bioreactor metagenome TaxID=1076179 RepID=A0A645CM15_9ZZZZ
MINLKKLTFSDAKKRIASIDSMTDIEFKELTDHWRRYEVDISNYDPSYVDFRNEIIETVKQALAETNNSMMITSWTFESDLKSMNFSAQKMVFQQ